MRTLAIINPHSGRTDDLSRVASLVRRHPAMGGGADIRITGEREDASLLAAAGVEHGFQRIFAVGGDGTLNEVVNGVMRASPEPDLVLGVLPLGTGNDFARTLGVPLDLEDALDSIEGLEARPTDLVRVSGGADRYLVNVSAGGFSGEVDERVTRERKRSWGPLAYLRGALDVLPDPETYAAEITVDGGDPMVLDVLNLAVGNGRTAAGGIPVCAEARVDDGLLDVVIVRAAGLSALAGFGSRCLVGKHLDHELCAHLRGAEVTVRSDPAMAFNVDGEMGAETPLTWTVLPGRVRFLAATDAPGYGDA